MLLYAPIILASVSVMLEISVTIEADVGAMDHPRFIALNADAGVDLLNRSRLVRGRFLVIAI